MDRRARNHMVVEFKTNSTLSPYHHSGALDPTVCDLVCQWVATGQWFSSVPPVSSTNKADRHDLDVILLKVALNTVIHP